MSATQYAGFNMSFLEHRDTSDYMPILTTPVQVSGSSHTKVVWHIYILTVHYSNIAAAVLMAGKIKQIVKVNEVVFHRYLNAQFFYLLTYLLTHLPRQYTIGKLQHSITSALRLKL